MKRERYSYPKLRALVRNIAPLEARRVIRRGLASPAQLSYWSAAKGIRRTENHQRLLALRDRHQGQRAFVIGNGPSLNKMDLTPLKDEITYGSNAFFLAFDRMGFLPTYYNVIDPLPAEDNAETLNKLEGTTKIFGHHLRYCLKPTPSTIYVFHDRYYAFSGHPDWPRFSGNALKGVFEGGTVAYFSLQLAYFMGIREVYLIGVDLDYKLPGGIKDGVIVSKAADQSHFHPDYFGPGKRWHHPHVDRMARAFQRAGEFFAAHDGAVYNATAGGKLEALPRASFEELFQLSSYTPR